MCQILYHEFELLWISGVRSSQLFLHKTNQSGEFDILAIGLIHSHLPYSPIAGCNNVMLTYELEAIE